MTFDELWRMNLNPNASLVCSGGRLETAERLDDSASNTPGLDSPDEKEIQRFLDWLERNP
jgi:hypothetical protein